MTDSVLQIKKHLSDLAKQAEPAKGIYFKTSPGDYAAHDHFLGINVPTLRKIAKSYKNLSLSDLRELLTSSFNEERLLALIILTDQYKVGSKDIKDKLFEFYLNNITAINNWNLVDTSAHLIVGQHLLNEDKTLLFTLAQSTDLWERRIAIVSTWYFIRNHHHQTTLKIAEMLLHDKHDLIHKAVGWMLRELGKRDVLLLKEFLHLHGPSMPRTMLRYAIEKFSENERKAFLQK